jgi:hypothetical protein
VDFGTDDYDFRLFTLNDQLYLTGTNSISPIWVNLPKVCLNEKEKKHIMMYDVFTKKGQSGPSLAVRDFASCCTSKVALARISTISSARTT